MGCRDDEDLALDRIDAEPTRGPAHRELAHARPLRLPDRAAWEAERQVLRERAAERNAQLSSRRREHLRDALGRPAPYLTEALGALPEKPRARRTWQQAATRIETYASTTPSPTPTTHSDHPPVTTASVRTGNAPTTNSNALNENSGTTTPASTPTTS